MLSELTEDKKLSFFIGLKRPYNDEGIAFLSDLVMKSGAGRPLVKLLGEIKDYKVTRPIVFALLACLLRRGADTKTALHVHGEIAAFNAFIMRTAFSVTTLSPSLYAERFAEVARKIHHSKSVGDIKITADLSSCYNAETVMDNGRFSKIMSDASINSAVKAKALLVGIYDCDPASINNVHVEHILPKISSHWKGWDGFPEVEKALYVNRIGNLALLHNDGARLEPGLPMTYKNKIKVYNSSAFPITQGVSNYGNQWMPETIDKRQKDLVRLVLSTWPI